MIGHCWWINRTRQRAGTPQRRLCHTNITGGVERTARLKDAVIGTTAVANTEGTRTDIETRQMMVMMIGSTVITILTAPERLMVMAVMVRKENEIQKGTERVRQGMVRGEDTGLASKLKPHLKKRRARIVKTEIHRYHTATGRQYYYYYYQ